MESKGSVSVFLTFLGEVFHPIRKDHIGTRPFNGLYIMVEVHYSWTTLRRKNGNSM